MGEKIPVATISLGPVHKKDVIKASTQLETGSKEYAVILAFDVVVARDITELAATSGVRIFRADIIYHLCDHFTEYMDEIRAQKKKVYEDVAIFPCTLR
eukprot:NODE_4698_length_338_cov_120.882353_g4090_i0.p1 GENE.NODE_4698_length_338_cov_120.882353_g4090_i0~~NODE_4698_length_338_cov_120.882353_g4090_i0.p1  ORF type:complete len:107 (+),score=31.26 NODE_4698_length_338_cov_120.882353_g4090_i0:25-321(+)